MNVGSSIRLLQVPRDPSRRDSRLDSRISLPSVQREHTALSISEHQPQSTATDLEDLTGWYATFVKNLDECNKVPQDENGRGYVIRLQQLTGVQVRKKDIENKLIVRIVANMYSQKNKRYYVRTYESGALQLLQSRNRKDEYQLADVHAIYVYTYSDLSSDMQLRAQILGYQMNKYQAVVTTFYFGAVSFNPFAASKNKLRQVLRNGLDPESKQTSVILSYTISATQSLRALYRLIPPNCLCGPEDYIPGLLAGGKLPQAASYLRLDYASISLLRIKVHCLELSDSLNTQLIKLAQAYFSSRFSNITQTHINSYFIKIVFHNGWKIVNEVTVDLVEKRACQIRMKNAIYTGIQYDAKNLVTLPFVFLENQCVLVFELLAKISSKSGDDVLNQNFAVAALMFPIGELRLGHKQATQWLMTGPLRSISNVLPSLSTPVRPRLRYEIQLTVSDKEPDIYQDHVTEEVDRLQIEKSRIVQEKKKIKWERRKIEQELTEEPKLPPLEDVIEETYMERLMKIKRERDNTLQQLEELKEKLREYDVPLDEVERQLELAQMKSEEDEENQHRTLHSIYYQSLLPADISKKIDSDLPYVLPRFEDRLTKPLVRTELMENAYSSWFMFNFLSIVSESHKIPRKLSVSIQFFCSQPLKTRILQPEPTTGELIHFEEGPESPNRHPIYTIKVDPDQNRPRDYFLNLLNYMQETKLQLTINDEDSQMEFGYVLIPLSVLIRRRRQEVKVPFESLIFYKEAVKGILKMEISNLKQPAPTSTNRLKESKPTTTAWVAHKTKVTKTILPGQSQSSDRVATSLRAPDLEITGEQRMKMRIQNLKRLKELKEGKSKTDSTVLNKHKIVGSVVGSVILADKSITAISYVNQVVDFEFGNSQLMTKDFQINIIDPDEEYLEYSELILLQDPEDIKYWKDLKYDESIVQNPPKRINPDLTFTLDKHQKICLTFKYQSLRQFDPLQTDPEKTNRERTISISVSCGQDLLGIMLLRVNPLPHPINMSLTYYVPHGQNVRLILPPILAPQTKPQLDLRVSFTNPKVIGSWPTDTQLSIVVPTPRPDQLVDETKFYMLVFKDDSLEDLLSLWKIKLVGCEKIVVNTQICTSLDMIVKVDLDELQNLKNQKRAKHFYVFSEDQKIIKIMGQLQRLQQQGSWVFRIRVTPNFVGTRIYNINVYDSHAGCPILWYAVQVNSSEPEYKQTFKITVPANTVRREELFQYTNPLPKKSVFNISTTNPYLLRAEENKLEFLGSKSRQIKLLVFSPDNGMKSAEVIMNFADESQQVQEFVLFKLIYA